MEMLFTKLHFQAIHFCFVVRQVYHNCEVSATTRYREGVIYLYNKYEALLKKTGKTSYQVSKDTGIGENTLSQWKTGRSNPKINKLKILAEYFGVPITYFIEEQQIIRPVYRTKYLSL